MEATLYRGIRIKMTSGSFDFDGYYENELIRGSARSEENAQAIIDETINYIIEYQERDLFDVELDFYLPKVPTKKYTDYDY